MRFSNFLLIVLLFLPISLFSGVNLKNGNFYISYTDHSFQKLSGFDLTRTYNSKSTEQGLFGYGWGSEIETRLYLIGDGSVLIKEHGAGSNTFFDAVQLDEAALSSCINQITEAALQKGDLGNNPSEINAFKQKLRNNREQRIVKWNQYVKADLVQVPFVQVGLKWSSTDRGSQSLEKTAAGFVRRYSNGAYDEFNEKGFFTGKYEASGVRVFSMEYNKNGELIRLTDKAGNKLMFTFNKVGFVESIKSPAGLSTYQYNDLNLIYSVDAGKNVYRYEYDAIHNMTAIRYNDNSAMLIDYYPVTYYVKQVTDRNGQRTEYVYLNFYKEDGSVNDDHYATYTIKQNEYTGKADSNYYEYEIRTGVNGARYTYRIIQRINGVVNETVYDETCQLPVLSRRGKQLVTNVYSTDCKLTYKEDNQYQVRMEYDPQLRKLIRMERLDRQDSTRRVSTYTYNQNGDLIRAQDEDGWVELSYNEQKKIAEMKYEEGTLLFEYNKIGKPVIIEVKGGGKLLVTYDSKGEITSVKSSDDNTQTSQQITRAFRVLLDRIKPTGVSID
jgi:YD repeat-containing protein